MVGGDVTFHGPGQLIVYPIVNLKRLKLKPKCYVEYMEHVIVRLLDEYGIKARSGYVVL